MRTKVSSGAPVPPKPAQVQPAAPRKIAGGPSSLVVPLDLVNEQVIIAAVMADSKLLKKLTSRIKPDHFYGKGHSEIWSSFVELARKGLDYSPETIRQVSGGKVDEQVLLRIAQSYASTPPNLNHHVEMLEWDRARVEASRGPVQGLLKLLQDPSQQPDVIRAAARSVSVAFDGFANRRYLRDPNELVREAMSEIRSRRTRQACYPYGIDGLDFDNQKQEWRITPGCAPGLITVVTGVPGSGKSTFTARVANGLIDQGRKVLYGAWEVKDKMTLELLSAMRLGISRARLMTGAISDEEDANIEQEMHHISSYVRFLQMPFGRVQGEKVSNERNLDVIHGYIADSGCDVAIFDLWKRCLRHTDPDDEEHALIRQQAIAEETGVHCLLVQQQRSKDMEQRPDKRPTREGIKGSGAWVEVPDTIFGIHRPALWKRIDDDVLEVDVLKQRWGKWPLAVEFDWMAEYGSITNGREVQYDPPGTSTNEIEDWAAGKKARR